MVLTLAYVPLMTTAQTTNFLTAETLNLSNELPHNLQAGPSIAHPH